MNLTDYEQQMLDGAFGEARQKAMEFITDYAVALAAPYLVPVSSVAGGLGSSKFIIDYYHNHADSMDAVFSEFKLNTSRQVSVPKVAVPTATLISLTDRRRSDVLNVDEAVQAYSCISEEYACSKGMQCLFTCTPYASGMIPGYGEHLAWMESSAVVAANSFFGARTNTESLESTGASSLTGRTPYWGLHCPENRLATIQIHVKARVQSDLDYGILGYYIGDMVQEDIPVITGLAQRPRFDQLKHLGAASAASGGVELCHIVGVTPEADTLQAATGKGKADKCVVVTDREMEVHLHRLNTADSGMVDLVILGCPHYSLSQVQEVLELLRGRKVSSSVTMWVFVPFTVLAICKRQGLAEELERAGVLLLSDTCPIVGSLLPPETCIAATNSVKQAHYLPSVMNIGCLLGSTEACIEAACSGSWSGSTR